MTARTSSPSSPGRPRDTSGATSALGRLVGDQRTFLAEQFTVAPHRWAAGDVGDLLSLADVDRLVTAGGLRRPAIRLVQDGTPIPPSSWTRTARTADQVLDDVVEPARLLDLHAAGATVVLQSLQRWWPPIVALCRELHEELGHAVQCNAYLTPAGAAGLAPHHDTHDVFVVQVHGHKHWTLREPTVEHPLPRHRSTAEEAAQQPIIAEVDLGPGDCLYLPRGFVHSARAQEGSSLHLTIGVLATTAFDVVREVVQRMADVPALRRPLPVRWADDPALAEDAVADVVRRVRDALGELDPGGVAAAMSARARANRRPDLSGGLLALDVLPRLGDHHRVVRRGREAFAVEPAGERVRLALPDRVVDLPGALAPVLAFLLDGCPHQVGELSPWLSPSSRLVLVRRLVRDGALRLVEDVPDAGVAPVGDA